MNNQFKIETHKHGITAYVPSELKNLDRISAILVDGATHITRMSVLSLSIGSVQLEKHGKVSAGIGICKGCMQELIYHCEGYLQNLKDLSDMIDKAPETETYRELKK